MDTFIYIKHQEYFFVGGGENGIFMTLLPEISSLHQRKLVVVHQADFIARMMEKGTELHGLKRDLFLN